jgi:hypothetical protein
LKPHGRSHLEQKMCQVQSEKPFFYKFHHFRMLTSQTGVPRPAPPQET